MVIRSCPIPEHRRGKLILHGAPQPGVKRPDRAVVFVQEMLLYLSAASDYLHDMYPHHAVVFIQEMLVAPHLQNADLRAGADANPGCLPECGSDDFSKAYYMMGVARPEDLPIGAWDTRVPGYRYWEPAALQKGTY